MKFRGRIILEFLPSRGFFICKLPTRAFHEINGDYAGNYCTTSWTWNPPEKWLFRRQLPALRRGIHRKNGYSARNYQLRDKESTRGMKFRWKLPAKRQEIPSVNKIPLGITSSWKLIRTGIIIMFEKSSIQ
jgi:hypothetical protein